MPSSDEILSQMTLRSVKGSRLRLLIVRHPKFMSEE